MNLDRITQGLQPLACQFSLPRQEWRDHHRGGDSLLDSLVSHGYAQEHGERFGITRQGQVRLQAEVANG